MQENITEIELNKAQDSSPQSIPPTMENQHNQTPQFQPPPPAIPEKKKSGKGCFIFTIVTLAVIFLFGITILLFIGGFFWVSSSFSDFTSIPMAASALPETFREQYISGDSFSNNKILVIDVRGIIIDGISTFSEIANSEVICKQLEQAQNDRSVKAIVLKLETPGGEVTAADTVYHKLQEVRSNGKIVVSSMGSLAASGGYYIAAASDYIIANRLTLTGSIGVIIQAYNYHDLLNKIGVYTETYKSGAMKDMLDGSKIRSEQEKEVVQDMVQETYNEFVKIVAEGRKNLSIEKIKNTEIGDGRVFSGQKALELGLVDQLGYFDDAIKKAAEMTSIQESYKVVYYMKKFSFYDVFSEFKAPDKSITVSIPGAKNWINLIEPGKMYFLPYH